MIAIVQALVLSFACVALLMPSYLRLLRHSGFGKRVRRPATASRIDGACVVW